MSNTINIIHMAPWPLGGSTSYVVNLAKTFEVAGVAYRILRPAARTESKLRQMGEFGVYYQNMSWDDLHRQDGVPLLASAPTDVDDAERVHTLVMEGEGKFVFHDPNEFGIYPHWKLDGALHNTICIREVGLEHVKSGYFIPHPYVRVAVNSDVTRNRMALSIARTSAVKNSHWILEANDRLPEQRRVVLYGEVNRMWWNFNVRKKWPDRPIPETAKFPRTYGTAVKLCTQYHLMVDLTIFKNDGGGTQYSFLEAMDGGAVPVMTKDWCSYPGPARNFGFQVENAEELYELLASYGKGAPRGHNKQVTAAHEYRQANYAYIAREHNPVSVAKQYCEVLL